MKNLLLGMLLGIALVIGGLYVKHEIERPLTAAERVEKFTLILRDLKKNSQGGLISPERIRHYEAELEKAKKEL